MATIVSISHSDCDAVRRPCSSTWRRYARVTCSKTCHAEKRSATLDRCCGQVRGQHYHHSKNEKFLVLSGNAEFNFKNLISNETFKIKTSERDPMIVRTIPGWIHNIKNIGKKELIVMLWANELFDPENPDTIAADI